MANGYFERGEMYDILFGDGLAGELTAHRPGIIVSGEEGNRTSPTVLVVYTTTTTTTGRDKSVNHEFVMNGWKNYALCNQIASVNKNRLKKLFGRLSDGDMRAIDGCLEKVLDLDYVDDAALKEKDREISDRDAVIAEKDSEIAELKALLAEGAAKAENIELSFKVEIAMWQKLYEKALNQAVDMKYANDLRLKESAPPMIKPEPPKAPEARPVDEDKADINHCTITALKKLGFSLSMAKKIVDGRPYNAVSDLKNAPGLKATQYRIMEPKLKCTPIVEKPKILSALPEPDPGVETETSPNEQETAAPKKANVNTASAQEIHEISGMSFASCFGITGYRKKNGPYASLDALLNASRMTPGILEKYRDKLEV